ncbi:MAG: serine/threonine protein kinase [Deltaproteobacteria bacterium]|nr:serine/threonine protein kinase [Deltaproteobacteria bacterium]
MADPAQRSWYCGRCLSTFVGDLESCPNLACQERRPEGGWGALYEAGEIIDRRYRVIRRLATGGAGITYLVREIASDGTEDGPELAVKVLWASRDHGAYLRRLSQEAQILQELDHPHIVVYRGFVHRTGEPPYLVTRFEHGGSLHDYVRQHGLLGLREAAGTVRQVLEALERAHQVGVIHRDLKPENVLLEALPEPGRTPVVRVADFGIAKVATSFGDTLTRAGSFLGTPQYAAPEQFEGLPPSRATDVFAAGALMWFCLQGQPLLPMASRLDPEDARDLLIQRLPARLRRPDGPPALVLALEEALSSAMAVEPEARCSAREMASMLEAVESGIPRPRQEPGSLGDTAGPGTPLSTWTSGPPVRSASDADPSPAPARAAPPRRRVLLAALAILALLSIACAGVGLVAVGGYRSGSFSTLPWLISRGTPVPTVPRSVSPPQSAAAVEAAAASEDGGAIQTAIPSLGIAAACGLTAPVQVDLVLEADGRVRSARPVQALPAAVSACVVSRLSGTSLPRTRAVAVTVRVRVDP